MSYSAAMEEMFASGDVAKTVVQTLEIDHPALAGPARWAMVIGEPIDGMERIVPLPILPGGDPVDHAVGFFTIVRPGADKSGPTAGRLRLEAVSGGLYLMLKEALGYDEPFAVTLREYLVGDGGLAAVTGPDGEISGLEMQIVDLEAAAADGSIEFPDGRNQNVPTGPNATFDRDNYPALFT